MLINSKDEIDITIEILRIFLISVYTYYLSLRIIGRKESIKYTLKSCFFVFLISIIDFFIKIRVDFLNSIIYVIVLLSILFAKITKESVGYSMLINTVSLSINYILFFIAIASSYFPNLIMKVNNDFIEFVSLIIFYSLFVYLFTKIKRFKKRLFVFKK